MISACLLGERCRYDGDSSLQKDLARQLQDRRVLPVCPEVAGGLSIPRPRAEIRDDGVITEQGEDVTEAFRSGAKSCLEEALEAGAREAILKSKSPSCGCGQIYDGSFDGRLVDGDGLFTQLLKEAGVSCRTELDPHP